MTLQLTGCVLLIVLGLAAYFAFPSSKVSEIGRLTFFCGLFWLAQRLGAHVVLSAAP